MTTRMWAVDIEGSGSSPPEIVELAIVEMADLCLTGFMKHWRFRPKGGITSMASRIHGIWETDVRDAPEFEDVADDIVMWLQDAPIVGHNVRIEVDLLTAALEDWAPRAAFDTLKLSRRLLPSQSKHGLEHLGVALNLDKVAAKQTGGVAHSAPYDAVLSALLLGQLLGPLSPEEREAALLGADILRGAQASLL